MKTIEFNPGASLESCYKKLKEESFRCGDVVRCGFLTGVVICHPYMTCFFINADGKQPTINYTCATLGEMWKSYRNDITVIGDVFQPEFADGKWKEL